MWVGVVKVMVDPETAAICLTSAVGRSSRENHCPALRGVVGNSCGAKLPLSAWAGGSCFIQTTRQSGAAQICPRPSGSVCQPAPEASSSKTIWPAEKRAALATVTTFEPLTASAVRLVDPATPVPSLVVDHRD